jgi:uncharacterized protein YecT (DUF1311 family)
MFKITIVFISIFCFFSTWASATSICSSNITKDLENCAKSNYELADQDLNKRYREIIFKLSEVDRNLLITAQREWVKYKERTCQEAYESTSPGREAGIDRWTCLDQITRTRTSEINYIDSGTGGDDFFRAVDVVSKYYEQGDHSRFIARLVADLDKDGSSDWRQYVSQTCTLAVRRTHEEKNTCIARQQFYRYGF